MHATFKETIMMKSEKSGDSETGICHPFPTKRKTDCPMNQFLKEDFSCHINVVNTQLISSI